jgi:hypothetical protein
MLRLERITQESRILITQTKEVNNSHRMAEEEIIKIEEELKFIDQTEKEK